MRQSEHDVEVRHRQQLGLTFGEPLFGGGALTLGTMPVTAAVVGDDGVRTLLTARHMAAERHRSAALDSTHHLQLVEAEVARIGGTPRCPVIAEDIRDLQRRTDHGRRYAGCAAFLPLVGFLRGCDSKSSGLSTLAINPVATRV